MSTQRTERSPGRKFAITVILGVLLSLPLLVVYLLIFDREQQSRTARDSIVGGWGAEQTLAGPFLAIPYDQVVQTITDGKTVVATQTRELTIAPSRVSIDTVVAPELRRRSIYQAVVYRAAVRATGVFRLPDIAKLGIDPKTLRFAQAELRFGISNAKGLGGSQPKVTINGAPLQLIPGSNLALLDNSGFSGVVGAAAALGSSVAFDIAFDLQGNGKISLIPTAADTTWSVRSSWTSPSFVGSFLPIDRHAGANGFSARWRVGNLALNRPVVSLGEPKGSENDAISVALINPVDLYDRVGRAAKYGALFIGFTFLTLLMFDVVGGTHISGVAYFLVGAGLILFFIMLLAFAEVIGFPLAYVIASGAIIGLNTTYIGAVLASWQRAAILGGMLTGLYIVLYVLLSLEAYALLIGSLMLFAALALVMYATRKIDWSVAGREANAIEY